MSLPWSVSMLAKRRSGFPAKEKDRRTIVLLRQTSAVSNPQHVNTGACTDNQLTHGRQLLFALQSREAHQSTSLLAGALLSIPSRLSGRCTERATKRAAPQGPATRQAQGKSTVSSQQHSSNSSWRHPCSFPALPALALRGPHATGMGSSRREKQKAKYASQHCALKPKQTLPLIPSCGFPASPASTSHLKGLSLLSHHLRSSQLGQKDLSFPLTFKKTKVSSENINDNKNTCVGTKGRKG